MIEQQRERGGKGKKAVFAVVGFHIGFWWNLAPIFRIWGLGCGRDANQNIAFFLGLGIMCLQGAREFSDCWEIAFKMKAAEKAHGEPDGGRWGLLGSRTSGTEGWKALKGLRLSR